MDSLQTLPIPPRTVPNLFNDGSYRRRRWFVDVFNNITTDLIMERLKSFILRYYPNFVCFKFSNGSYFLTLYTSAVTVIML